MHEIKLIDLADDKALTRTVLQISQMLGMYQAELARVLGIQCGDVGAFASARAQLQSGSPPWQRARQFVSLYERLFEYCDGDAVDIFHWLRVRQPGLPETPLLLMVDEGRLEEVLAWFESAPDRRQIYAGKNKP